MRKKQFLNAGRFTRIIYAILCFFKISICQTLPELALLPLPQTIQPLSGHFNFKLGIDLEINLSDTIGLKPALTELKTEFSRFTAGKLSAKQKLILQLFPAHQSSPVKSDPRIGNEGYVLQIDRRNISLGANSSTGLFYGLQTLKQIVRSGESAIISCMKIIDWPDFPYRGMQDDISRGPVPTLALMKQQIRRCAELKLNIISYYTENVVITSNHGDFTPAGAGLTLDEWHELEDYARQYHMELIPNFQSFGHFEKILAYPQYAHLGEAGRMLSPVLDESYQFLAEIYAEMAPVFSSHFFNVNCDETWDLGRRQSKALVDSMGIAQVYARHMQRISQELRKYDKRMLMWADIVLAHPEIRSLLPPETILLTWNYSALDSFVHMIEPLQEAGFETWICPGVVNSHRLMPDYRMTRSNIVNFIRDGKLKKVPGVLNTVWDDGGAALFSRDWYGVALAAEQSWQAQPENKTTFDRRFSRVIYQDQSENFARAIQSLMPLTDLAPTQEMTEKCFWQTMVPARGEKLIVNLQDWDTVQIRCDSAEHYLAQSSPCQYELDLDYYRLTIDQYQFMAQSKFELLTAADAYREACRRQREQVFAREELLKSYEKVESLNGELARLKSTFKKLWLAENRWSGLDWVLARYDQKQAELTQTLMLLTEALKDFDQGLPLPPPNYVRLDLRRLAGMYFASWLICGAFPIESKSMVAQDYLVAMGGELNCRPTVWSEVDAPDSHPKRWRKYSSPTPTTLNLASIFEDKTLVVAYAYCRIESDRAQSVKATFGSNDGIKIMLNGQTLYQHFIKRNLIPDEEAISLPLQKGQNPLLLKIFQQKGDWGFSFRLPDVTVRNHDYKYRIIPD